MRDLGRILFGASLLVTGLVACASEQADDAAEGPTGQAQLAIQVVPSDALCVEITAAGNRTVQRSFDLAPGAAAQLSMNGLPTGQVAFSALTYNEPCGGTRTSAPTWTSPSPVTAVISSQQVTPVIIPLRRNGQAGIGLDFEDPTTCQPVTCAQIGASCGVVNDGCGGMINCGTCVAPQTCGGSGVANVCGGGTSCGAITCQSVGANCGTIIDACNQAISCGSCPAGQICGGGGTNNQCVSACTSNAGCPAGTVCSAGACVASGALGQACTSNSQCSTNNCVNGYCMSTPSCVDNDADGWPAYTATCPSGRDCDDSRANVNPAAQELCGNTIDDNCNGLIDDGC
jgi:hypothetical protein